MFEPVVAYEPLTPSILSNLFSWFKSVVAIELLKELILADSEPLKSLVVVAIDPLKEFKLELNELLKSLVVVAIEPDKELILELNELDISPKLELKSFNDDVNEKSGTFIKLS